MEWMCAAASWETRHWAAAPLHWYLMMSSHKGVSHLHHRPIPIITHSRVTADLFVLVECVAEAIFRQMVRAERMMSTAVQSPMLCKRGSGNTVLLLIFNCGRWWTDNHNIFAPHNFFFFTGCLIDNPVVNNCSLFLRDIIRKALLYLK